MVQSIHPNEWIGLNDYGNKARECFNKTPQLEEHPNIMKLHGRFIDKTPLLHDSIDSYPGALPKRLFSDGYGRNQTLCLVMPKFSHSLRDYLHKEKLNTSQRTSLFWQLLEGVAYLERHMIAHRDLKSDNLLIDCYGDGYQHLVVTDFGSCLACEDMLLPYETSYIDRGGNIALMAPEVPMFTLNDMTFNLDTCR